MKKTLLAKGMEMVENEREIRKALIAKSEKSSEELYRIGKEAAESLEGMVRDKELSRSTKKELIRYGRYLAEMKKLAENLNEFNALLKTTQAERAEVVHRASDEMGKLSE